MVGNGIKLPSVALFLAAAFSFSVVADEVKIGELYKCAHEVSGTVFAKNDLQIVIKDFTHDGKGPGPYFHAQLKGETMISTVEGKYERLRWPTDSNDECKKLDQAYKADDKKEVVITLPKSIKEYASIGVLCYEACHNFGHVAIPDNLAVDPQPADVTPAPACPVNPHKPCPVAKQGEIAANCQPPVDPGTGTNETDTGSDGSEDVNGAAGLTFTSGWLIFSLFLLFGKQ